jgi:hypothetical protein
MRGAWGIFISGEGPSVRAKEAVYALDVLQA